MAASLKGTPELRRRLKAIKLVFKTAGRDWADETAAIAKTMVPTATGKTRASIRRKNASQRKATVYGRYPVNFIDAGSKAHDIQAKGVGTLKFAKGGNTYFRKKVHKQRIPARPFKKRAAAIGLERTDIMGDVIELWNRAA